MKTLGQTNYVLMDNIFILVKGKVRIKRAVCKRYAKIQKYKYINQLKFKINSSCDMWASKTGSQIKVTSFRETFVWPGNICSHCSHSQGTQDLQLLLF